MEACTPWKIVKTNGNGMIWCFKGKTNQHYVDCAVFLPPFFPHFFHFIFFFASFFPPSNVLQHCLEFYLSFFQNEILQISGKAKNKHKITKTSQSDAWIFGEPSIFPLNSSNEGH